MTSLAGTLPAAALLALSFTFGAHAQTPNPAPGCANCGMRSYVDIPGTRDAHGGLFIAGWGFECASGQPADRVDVWWQQDDGFFAPAGGAGTHGNGLLTYGLYRPDVLQHYAPYCPASNGMVGWHFYFTAQVPPGTRQVKINVWRGPFMETHTRVVLFE